MSTGSAEASSPQAHRHHKSTATARDHVAHCFAVILTLQNHRIVCLCVQAALNQKMADFTADAQKFTMDGGIVYDFKDEDDYKTAKKDLSHLKKAMASNWVEQPRQRKVRAHLCACAVV